ncbi:hypothetical protein V6N13_090064 [Hibiscus sabdariffa]|uniref:Uncharacterized protein n=1 Tax=Hibiscus sabdariffa TaxID=183260 RepID=A0ABR2QIC1_9ROSI
MPRSSNAIQDFKWTSFQVCVQELFALFSCSVRKDPEGSGFSLSAIATNGILKIATSADYGVCKGKRQDGMACTHKYGTCIP